MRCSQIDLARAITQAVEHGAHIINISGGELDAAGEGHQLLSNAVRLCASEGVLIVAAAGNDGCRCLHVPAALPAVLAVGAMDARGRPLEFSNWGDAYRRQGILALGEKIVGAVPGGGTERRSGTSYATPIVSGVAALLVSLQLKRGRRAMPRAARNAILGSAIGCEEQPVADCQRLLVGRLNIPGAFLLLNKGVEMETSENTDSPDVAMVQPQEAVCSLCDRPAEVLEVSGIRAAEIPAVASAAASPSASVPSSVSLPLRGSRSAAEERGTQVTVSGCGDGIPPAKVYALGQIGYDFGTEARRDSFIQNGVANPDDPTQLLAYLKDHPAHATAVNWTLTQETTAIYALQPGGAFASEIYATLRELLKALLTEGAERVSIPGYVAGKAELLNGQTVPIIWPDLRGIYSWSTAALLEAVIGKVPSGKDRAGYNAKAADISNFLDRVYYELRNLGLSSQERAINFAATNAFQVERVFHSAILGQLKLNFIAVERSPICRPESDCWDVKLTFFQPMKRLEQAQEVYRFTVDVSDVVPVTVGRVRHWQVF
jgi:cyanobactin maturation PatA/PatG family protease